MTRGPDVHDDVHHGADPYIDRRNPHFFVDACVTGLGPLKGNDFDSSFHVHEFDLPDFFPGFSPDVLWILVLHFDGQTVWMNGPPKPYRPKPLSPDISAGACAPVLLFLL